MKIIVDAQNVNVQWAQVDLSVNHITRQFTLREIADFASFETGSEVQIYTDNDQILIDGVIEYTQTEAEREYVYAGRNKSRYLADCYAEETIQFSASQPMESVIGAIASKYGISITGCGASPKSSSKTMLIGDRIGKVVLDAAFAAGKIVLSDAEGNISIEEASEEGDIELSYGVNIRSRSHKHDHTQEYDKYIIVAQSNYLSTGQQDANVIGSYGKGLKSKVILSPESLSVAECELIAKAEYNKDRRQAFSYLVVLDSDLQIELGKSYKVTDSQIGISEMLSVQSISHIHSTEEKKQIVNFERKEI